MCHVITIFSSRGGMQPVNRVKVFLVVTCPLEVSVCWSEQWMAVRVRAGMQWQQTHRKRQRDKDTCMLLRHHQSSHTATSSGLRPARFATFYYAAETYITDRSLGVHSGFSVGPDHWRGVGASCWVGEFEGFSPSWQFTRVQSALLKQSARGQWM